MKLNALEFVLMNNTIRLASQGWLETPLITPSRPNFTGQEFYTRLKRAGLPVKQWRQWSEWGIIGQASK